MELSDILVLFGIDPNEQVERIYESAWSVGRKYILKKNADRSALDKSVSLTRLLLKEGIPVAEYLITREGKPYIQADNTNYCLMKKISGRHLDPYAGDPYENGLMLGRIVADLHAALIKIGDDFPCYDARYREELEGWILKEIRAKNMQIEPTVIGCCYEFEPLYHRLPRQLIHRDMHLGNLLFDDGGFSGYLDFDISQKNVRLFDLCYLGASMLVGHYQDKARFHVWSNIFRGVIEGYETASKLTQEEKRAVPYMFVLIELTFTAFFSKSDQRDVSNGCAEMTEWLYRHRNLLSYPGE